MSSDIFEDWSDVSAFKCALVEIGEIAGARCGLAIDVCEATLDVVHSNWVAGCKLWLKELPDTSDDLSHLKKASVLYAHIADADPFKVTGMLDPINERSYQDVNWGPTEEVIISDAETRLGLIDGGSAYLGWMVIYEICDFFEQHRTDRMDDYEPRITEDFVNDMLASMKKGYMNERSIHMSLKGLFIRD